MARQADAPILLEKEVVYECILPSMKPGVGVCVHTHMIGQREYPSFLENETAKG